jgi:hypothetical protein
VRRFDVSVFWLVQSWPPGGSLKVSVEKCSEITPHQGVGEFQNQARNDADEIA